MKAVKFQKINKVSETNRKNAKIVRNDSIK